MHEFVWPPISVILTWPAPNYVNPEEHDRWLIPLVFVIQSLTILFVAGRLYTRVVLTRNVGYDDYTAIVALVSFQLFHSGGAWSLTGSHRCVLQDSVLWL